MRRFTSDKRVAIVITDGRSDTLRDPTPLNSLCDVTPVRAQGKDPACRETPYSSWAGSLEVSMSLVPKATSGGTCVTGSTVTK